MFAGCQTYPQGNDDGGMVQAHGKGLIIRQNYMDNMRYRIGATNRQLLEVILMYKFSRGSTQPLEGMQRPVEEWAYKIEKEIREKWNKMHENNQPVPYFDSRELSMVRKM